MKSIKDIYKGLLSLINYPHISIDFLKDLKGPLLLHICLLYTSVIFGATGGVMEAALRTVYEVVTGKTLEKIEFDEVRGLEGIKEATID